MFELRSNQWQRELCNDAFNLNKSRTICTTRLSVDNSLYLSAAAAGISQFSSLSITAKPIITTKRTMQDFTNFSIPLDLKSEAVQFFEVSGFANNKAFNMDIYSEIPSYGTLNVYQDDWTNNSCNAQHSEQVASCPFIPDSSGKVFFMYQFSEKFSIPGENLSISFQQLEPSALVANNLVTGITISPYHYFRTKGLKPNTDYVISLTNIYSGNFLFGSPANVRIHVYAGTKFEQNLCNQLLYGTDSIDCIVNTGTNTDLLTKAFDNVQPTSNVLEYFSTTDIEIHELIE